MSDRPAKDLLSVVICSYNRAESLRIAATTVIAQEAGDDFDYELLVIDDHSTDHTRAVVEALAAADPRVRYVLNNVSKGIAGARNAGVHAARGNWIVFFDDDQLSDPGWLRELLAVARAHDARIVGGARRLDLDDVTLRGMGPVVRSLLGENLYDGPPVLMQGKELPTTGNLLISKEVFDRVGDFDLSLTLNSGEDAELIGRARAAGFGVWTAPKAVVAHMIPAYRTQENYFIWVSRRWGVQFAQIDVKRRGRLMGLALALARGVQAVALRWPQYYRAKGRGDAAALLDVRCYLWRTEAYVRKAIYMAWPAMFPQHRFLDYLEFRNERQLFGGG